MARNKIVLHEGREVRVIAEGEGWSMVRRKGAMPFVVRSSELSQPTQRAADGEEPVRLNFTITDDDVKRTEELFPHLRRR